jgi:hypothetical protein
MALHGIMDYQFASLAEVPPDAMDPRSAEKINGKLLMKIGTLACFLLAGALLITSLFVPPPAQSGTDGGASQGSTASIR